MILRDAPDDVVVLNAGFGLTDAGLETAKSVGKGEREGAAAPLTMVGCRVVPLHDARPIILVSRERDNGTEAHA